MLCSQVKVEYKLLKSCFSTDIIMLWTVYSGGACSCCRLDYSCLARLELLIRVSRALCAFTLYWH